MAFTTRNIPDITNGLGGTGDPGLQLRGTLYVPDPATFPPPWNCVVGTVASGFRNGNISLLANIFGAGGLVERGFLCLAFQVRLLTPVNPTQTTSGVWHQQTDDFKIGVRFMRSDPGGFGFGVTGWVGGVGGSGSAHHCIYCCVSGTAGDDRLDAGIPMSPVTDMGDPAFVGSELAIVQAYGNSTNATTLTNESPISLTLANAKPIRHYNGDNEAMPLSQQSRFSAAILAAGVTTYVAITNTGSLGRIHSYAQWPSISGPATTWLIAQTTTPPPPPPTDTTPPIFSFATVPSSGAEVDVSLIEADSRPCLPVSGVTGFTVKVNGLVRDITNASFLDATTLVLVTSGIIFSGDTITVEYAPGNVTDSASPTPNVMVTFPAQTVANGSSQSRTPGPVQGAIILTVPLQPGTLLSNVRYYWDSFGAKGSAQTTGISQPDPLIPEFRFSVVPPVNAEEMIAYDVTDPTNNWNPAQYLLCRRGQQAVLPPIDLNQAAFLYPGRIVNFRSVFEAILRRLGIDPYGDRVRQDALRSVTEHINERVRYAWRVWDWPGLDVLEERAFRTTWTATLQFVRGDELYYAVNGLYYDVKLTAPTDPPIGTLPTSTMYFEPLSLADKYIAFDQINQIPIGEVIHVYQSNPRIARWSPLIPFQVSTKGIDVGGWGFWDSTAANTVWIRYKVVPSEFTTIPFIASKIYNAGDLVLSETTGQSYKCLVDNTTAIDPTADSTKWGIVPFPDIFASYVKAGAYADCLGEIDEWVIETGDVRVTRVNENRQVLRAEANNEADQALMQEIDRLTIMGQKNYSRSLGFPGGIGGYYGDGIIGSPIWPIINPG